jgi:hypothetical protein
MPCRAVEEILTILRAYTVKDASIWYDQVLSLDPQPPGMYEYILSSLSEDEAVTFGKGGEHTGATVSDDQALVLLRHDLDRQPEKLGRLTDVERRLGLRSSVYLRVDARTYQPGDFAGPLRALKGEGYEVGLHSLAYGSNNPVEALRREMGEFERILGFLPDSMNTHGGKFGKRYLYTLMRRRRDFLEHRLWENIENPPLFIDHNDPRRPFHSLFADGNWRLNRRVSYVERGILRVGETNRGKKVVFLTHPNHWS